MSLEVMAQLWLCRISGYLAILLLLASQSMAPAQRLGWLPSQAYLRWRRRLGIHSAWLASVHVLVAWRTLLAGYFLPAFRETCWTQLGLGAWLILLALWLTSYARVVRRLRVVAWRSLHRLAYAATLLAILHALLAPWSNPWVHLAFLTYFCLIIILRLLPVKAILKR